MHYETADERGEGWPSELELTAILCAARRAGPRWILSRGSPAVTAALTSRGLAREHLGHLVLTPIGVARRRGAGAPPTGMVA